MINPLPCHPNAIEPLSSPDATGGRASMAAMLANMDATGLHLTLKAHDAERNGDDDAAEAFREMASDVANGINIAALDYFKANPGIQPSSHNALGLRLIAEGNGPSLPVVVWPVGDNASEPYAVTFGPYGRDMVECACGMCGLTDGVIGTFIDDKTVIATLEDKAVTINVPHHYTPGTALARYQDGGDMVDPNSPAGLMDVLREMGLGFLFDTDENDPSDDYGDDYGDD